MSRLPPVRHRVLVADDHAVVAEGIVLALATHFTVVGSVGRLEELLPAIRRLRPDVVVLDFAFPEGSSLPAMREALADPTIRCRFVVLTAHDSGALARAATEAGAMAFVTKAIGAQDLRLVVSAVAEGRVVPSRSAPGPRHERAATRGRHTIGGAVLSTRQVQILVLLLDGVPRKRIAGELHLTLKGVDYNVQAIKAATGMADMLRLMRWMHEHRDRLIRILEDLPGSGLPSA